MKLCIGLFGTCGGSAWREPFMAAYQERDIEFYNPQVDDWKPELAQVEAEHLASDQIILFPITGETYGMGSLAETGFSILNAIRLEHRRDFVILIESQLAPELEADNPQLYRESLRTRALVSQHLRKLRLPNLYLVDSLEEMLAVSLTLHEAARLRQPLERFNPHRRDD